MWKVEQTSDGWIVTFGGRQFGAAKGTEQEAAAYRERLIARYPHAAGVDLIIDANGVRKGGPYRVTWPNGDTEILRGVNSKADAKTVILYRLNQKRLPRGLRIETARRA